MVILYFHRDVISLREDICLYLYHVTYCGVTWLVLYIYLYIVILEAILESPRLTLITLTSCFTCTVVPTYFIFLEHIDF